MYNIGLCSRNAVNPLHVPFFSRRSPDEVFAVAHRGGVGDNAADPLAALVGAVELGFRYFEIDLRATTDGRLVVWHGEGLERLRPNRRLDLRSHRAVLFGDVLATLPKDTRYFVDLKDEHGGLLLPSVVGALGATARVCVGSFSHRRTAAAAAAFERELGTRPCTAAAPREVVRMVTGRPSRCTRAPSLQIPGRLATRRLIRQAHEDGVFVIAWTINEEAEMHRLIDRGVDGLMSDRLESLKRVLTARGRWPGEGATTSLAGG